MSHYDSKQNKVIRYEPEPYPGYEDKWLLIDCGCSSGLEWMTLPPTECRTCGGGGFIAQHIESGALAHYPGGPFCGVS